MTTNPLAATPTTPDPFDSAAHVAALTQAVCDIRRRQGVAGPLFLGRDTQAASQSAYATALEVLADNHVPVRVDATGGGTPAPAISRAILTHNRRHAGLAADGLLITPSPHPPAERSIRYESESGGPPAATISRWIEDRARRLLAAPAAAARRLPHLRPRRPHMVQAYDYVGAYVHDLESAVDMDAIVRSGLRIRVDARGDAAEAVWSAIADHYGLAVEFRDDTAPDGRYDLAFGSDPDGNRYEVETRNGPMPSDRYLVAATDYLLGHRPAWRLDAAVARTVVSSALVDRVAARAGRRLLEMPVGFRFYVPGLLDGSVALAGGERAAASFLQRSGATWTTDRDGVVMDLLAAEMMARTGRDPSEWYADVASALGEPIADRRDVPATPEERAALWKAPASAVQVSHLAGDAIDEVRTVATGNGAPLGGLKVVTKAGWFSARPSATEPVYRLCAESFRGPAHLEQIQADAQAIIGRLFLGGNR